MSGARPLNADLFTDSDAIRQLMTELSGAGRYLVILMNSYGGQVGTNALGLSGGVINLIYFGAQALVEDQSGTIDFAEDGSCVHQDPKNMLIGPDRGIPEEELESYVASLGRWNGKVLAQPLQHCAWREIPKAMVEEIKAAGKEIQTFDLESGHCPTTTKPEELATIIEQIVTSPVA
ncbi:hypothetical protein N7540_003376 [Penicillium herquei]|nr:hypothetical protein N7540_003376 [Penicillium herquei]